MLWQYYDPTDPQLWQGRREANPQQRIHQIIQLIDLKKQNLQTQAQRSIAFLGFCSDEGIIRNQGRPGAKLGPDAFRAQMANLAAHGIDRAYDLGNIICKGHDLEGSQQSLGAATQQLYELNYLPIIIGGGHELAWGHYQGIHQSPHREQLGIINIDAHFDLREPPKANYGTSGTPFTQIARVRQHTKLEFSYACLGIQPHANTPDLFERAEQLNCQYLTADSLQTDPAGAHEFINQFLKAHQAIYVSICLDAFAANIAPGVSAPQPLGLYPQHISPLIKYIAQSGKVIGLDIAELSPPNDYNNITSQLAASLCMQFVTGVKSGL